MYVDASRNGVLVKPLCCGGDGLRVASRYARNAERAVSDCSSAAENVANGVSDFAIATDCDGSVRLAATCHGLFGMKSTNSSVDRPDFDSPCVMARNMTMLQAGMKALDPTFEPTELKMAPKLARIKSKVSSDVGDPLVFALMDAYPDMPYRQLQHIEAAFDAASANGINASQCGRIEKVRAAFTRELEALFETCEAIVTPALPFVPPMSGGHRSPNAMASLTRFLRPFNLSGHPAITLPARSNDGQPIGLQIVGRKGEDARLCAIASWMVSCVPLFQSKE